MTKTIGRYRHLIDALQSLICELDGRVKKGHPGEVVALQDVGKVLVDLERRRTLDAIMQSSTITQSSDTD